jgi:hypothetical protein
VYPCWVHMMRCTHCAADPECLLVAAGSTAVVVLLASASPSVLLQLEWFKGYALTTLFFLALSCCLGTGFAHCRLLGLRCKGLCCVAKWAHHDELCDTLKFVIAVSSLAQQYCVTAPEVMFALSQASTAVPSSGAAFIQFHGCQVCSCVPKPCRTWRHKRHDKQHHYPIVADLPNSSCSMRI